VKFGLSGSSARKLKRGGANLLAGRALLNHLYPLTADELGKDFDLNATLNWGLLPSVVTQSDPIVRRELLETYVAVYLREEIREEQHLRNLDPFIRFLEVAAQTSGQIVNYSAIGRDCSVDSRAVARYFQILEETLLGFLLPPFDRSVRKQQGKSPKFYLFDIGVMRTLERTVTIPINPGSYGYGRLFEHFVMWEIIKCNEYSRRKYKLSYLVTKDGAEINLIVERPEKATILIEIKSGVNPKIEDARHAVRFREDFGNAEVWVVSQIERERIEAGVRFLGWQEALRELFKEGEPELGPLCL
jgi:predicted AAA+ superfamily ATPase